MKCNTTLRTAVGDVFRGDRLPDSFPVLRQSDGQPKTKIHMFLRHPYIIIDEVSRCNLSELGQHSSSNADYQELHTVSATCSYTVTFITVHTNKLSVCFVLFISRRYQRLTLYSGEYDCWTSKWTRIVCGFLRLQGFLFVVPRRLIGN